MEVRNCRSCGRLFNYMVGHNICPLCAEELEKKFLKVKDYIHDNPNASIAKIAEENDVTANQIKQWVREERLQFAENSGIGIECEKCGKIIQRGKYCKDCKETIANNLTEAFARPVRNDKIEKNDKDKMYFNRR